MRLFSKNLPLLAALALLGLELGCSHTDVAGNGGGGTGSEVVGMVYQPDLSGAAGAQVQIVAADRDPQAGSGLDTTLTANSAGRYEIAGLPAGAYNVFSQKDALYAYTAGIAVSYTSTGAVAIDTIRDTLHSPGSISGTVQLQPGDAVTTVLFVFLGTAIPIGAPDSSGRFAFADLAAGTYHVRILSILDSYLPLDTTFTIIAGQATVLTHPIVLQYAGIPVPSGLKMAYDSLKQIVSLSWNKPTTGRPVSGYNVYRQDKDSTAPIRIKSGITDTICGDSTGIQDQTYEYRVAAIDTSGTEGVKSTAITVTIKSAYVFMKDFGDSGAGVGQLLFSADIAFDKNDNLWVLDNGRNKVLKYSIDGTFLLEWGTAGTDSGQIMSPSGLDIDKEQNLYIAESGSHRIQKFDMAGNCLMRIDSIGMTAIVDVSVDDSGFAYIFGATDTGTSMIYKYDSSGTPVTAWTAQAEWLKSAILARNHKVYCAGAKLASGQSYLDNFIEVFSDEGNALQTINLRRAGDTATIDIGDLDVDAKGWIYAVESESGTIRVFDVQGNPAATFGRKTLFPLIQGIAISSGGIIAISDRSRIHLYRLP